MNHIAKGIILIWVEKNIFASRKKNDCLSIPILMLEKEFHDENFSNGFPLTLLNIELDKREIIISGSHYLVSAVVNHVLTGVYILFIFTWKKKYVFFMDCVF